MVIIELRFFLTKVPNHLWKYVTEKAQETSKITMTVYLWPWQSVQLHHLQEYQNLEYIHEVLLKGQSQGSPVHILHIQPKQSS
jgi:hypothetical protein